MPFRPVIQSKYIDTIREIRYLGLDAIKLQDRPELHVDQQSNTVSNNGHYFQLLSQTEKLYIPEDTFEVIGWVERTLRCPYDFILLNTRTKQYYVANLHGRSDKWPLFAIQDSKVTCSRTGMGSAWNCRLCAKYFGTVCRGR